MMVRAEKTILMVKAMKMFVMEDCLKTIKIPKPSGIQASYSLFIVSATRFI